MTEIKSKIVLISYEKEEKGEVVELFNFTSLDHYYDTVKNHSCYRINCDGRFYYFVKIKTSIIEIKVF